MKQLENWLPTICLTVLLAIAIICHAGEEIEGALALVLLIVTIF